jgi:hypothetical protein
MLIRIPSFKFHSTPDAHPLSGPGRNHQFRRSARVADARGDEPWLRRRATRSHHRQHRAQFILLGDSVSELQWVVVSAYIVACRVHWPVSPFMLENSRE